MDVQLLVPEAKRDSSVWVVDNLSAKYVAVKGCRALPVAHGDDHMVQPHLSTHLTSLTRAPCQDDEHADEMDRSAGRPALDSHTRDRRMCL